MLKSLDNAVDCELFPTYPEDCRCFPRFHCFWQEMATPFFLGFDSSTQQLKAIAIDRDLNVVTEASVHFDNDLPEFKTHGGVHRHENNLTVTAPTLMWVKAFDLVLDRLREKGCDFGSVTCLSGTGQQHGSVYWKKGARETLRNLQRGRTLFEQLEVNLARDLP